MADENFDFDRLRRRLLDIPGHINSGFNRLNYDFNELVRKPQMFTTKQKVDNKIKSPQQDKELLQQNKKLTTK